MDSHVTNTYVLLATLELIKKELATVLMSAKSVLQVTQVDPKIDQFIITFRQKYSQKSVGYSIFDNRYLHDYSCHTKRGLIIQDAFLSQVPENPIQEDTEIPKFPYERNGDRTGYPYVLLNEIQSSHLNRKDFEKSAFILHRKIQAAFYTP